MQFFSTSNTCLQRCLYPLFQNQPPISCCPLFLEEFLNPQITVNKMVHEHTVDYQPSLSELTSRIHPLIFLMTLNKFISPKHFLNFFSNLYILAWLLKSYGVNSVKITDKYICELKIESVHFYLGPQVKLSPRFLSSPLDRRKLPISPEQQWSGKNNQINLGEYWSQVLINSAIFATFTFLVSVLFCHNLD